MLSDFCEKALNHEVRESFKYYNEHFKMNIQESYVTLFNEINSTFPSNKLTEEERVYATDILRKILIEYEEIEKDDKLPMWEKIEKIHKLTGY